MGVSVRRCFLKSVFRLTKTYFKTPHNVEMDDGCINVHRILPFSETFHKRFSLKSSHIYSSHDSYWARQINVNFTEYTLLWIILTIPKNKHSSHQPKEGQRLRNAVSWQMANQSL